MIDQSRIKTVKFRLGFTPASIPITHSESASYSLSKIYCNNFNTQRTEHYLSLFQKQEQAHISQHMTHQKQKTGWPGTQGKVETTGLNNITELIEDYCFIQFLCSNYQIFLHHYLKEKSMCVRGSFFVSSVVIRFILGVRKTHSSRRIQI